MIIWNFVTIINIFEPGYICYGFPLQSSKQYTELFVNQCQEKRCHLFFAILSITIILINK